MWSILGSLSSGRKGNLGAEDRRAVWGCGGTRPEGSVQRLGAGRGKCACRGQRDCWGGEAVLGQVGESAKGRARGGPGKHLGGHPFLSLTPYFLPPSLHPPWEVPWSLWG